MDDADVKNLFKQLRERRDEWRSEDEVYIVAGTAFDLLNLRGLVQRSEPAFHARTGLSEAVPCKVLAGALFGRGSQRHQLERVNRPLVEMLGARPCRSCFPRFHRPNATVNATDEAI